MTGTEFVKGDTVRLKSGGPIMTVTNIGDRMGELAVWCMWFEKMKKMEDTFPPEALEKRRLSQPVASMSAEPAAAKS